jgi:hypothetical protein
MITSPKTRSGEATRQIKQNLVVSLDHPRQTATTGRLVRHTPPVGAVWSTSRHGRHNWVPSPWAKAVRRYVHPSSLLKGRTARHALFGQPLERQTSQHALGRDDAMP